MWIEHHMSIHKTLSYFQNSFPTCLGRLTVLLLQIILVFGNKRWVELLPSGWFSLAHWLLEAVHAVGDYRGWKVQKVDRRGRSCLPRHFDNKRLRTTKLTNIRLHTPHNKRNLILLKWASLKLKKLALFRAQTIIISYTQKWKETLCFLK